MLIFAAGVAAAVMHMIMCMMVTMHIRIIAQFSFQKCFYCLVCIARHTPVQMDSGLRQSGLGACSNTAANKGIYLQIRQHVGQRPMSATKSVPHDGNGDV